MAISPIVIVGGGAAGVAAALELDVYLAISSRRLSAISKMVNILNIG